MDEYFGYGRAAGFVAPSWMFASEVSVNEKSEKEVEEEEEEK